MAQKAPFSLNAPIQRSVLRRLRLKLRKLVPSAGLGAHLHRRMGQSLEFREYRDYAFGDDIRTVDWAASARSGSKWNWVAKSFEAEERRTLIVLLDCRPAMRLPFDVPKLGVATWIAECLVIAALEEGDRVIVAPVFAGAHSHPPFTIEGQKGIGAMQKMVSDILASPVTQDDWDRIPQAGLGQLPARLKPAAVVVMLTDALFDDPGDEFARFSRRAQKSFRTFHLVEIDSWPHEQALLRANPFRLQAMAGKRFDDQLSEATDGFLEEAEALMGGRRAQLRARCAGPGIIWPKQPLSYPKQAEFAPDEARAWFADVLLKADFLDSLLSRVG